MTGFMSGRLIVIMLFRLQMSIDDAIRAYTILARDVFVEKKWCFQEGTFKASRLEDAVLTIIREADKEKEDPNQILLLDDKGPKWYVVHKWLFRPIPYNYSFVCAMSEKNMRFPTLFRSWIPPANASYNCTIVEATRATTAAPSVFKAVKLGHRQQRYLDGGFRCNNPVKYVLEEAQSVYPNYPISCIVSLGTGARGVIGLERPDAFQKFLPTKLLRVLKEIAGDCEIQSEDIARQYPNLYFRLNVDEGLQNVSLAEWDKLSEVDTHTSSYLKRVETTQKVDRLVQVLSRHGPACSSLHYFHLLFAYVCKRRP